MKNYAILIICLIVLSTSALAAVTEYKVTLDTVDEIVLTDIQIEIKDFPDFRTDYSGEYVWRIYSGDNFLNFSYFDIEGVILYDSVNPETGEIDGGGELPVKLDEVELYIPYYANADRIAIFKINESTTEKTEVLGIDISDFAKEKIVVEGSEEDSEETPEQTQPGTTEEETTEKNDRTETYTIIVFIILLVLVILHFAIEKKHG
ncbi:MAG: hypothetical protein KJ847_01865 [Firmicutes bacterium]|nr:hypothetical protein [Bacillota bacterium]